MASGGRPVRGSPRDRIKIVDRDRKARKRKLEAILRRRVLGMRVERIAHDLDIGSDVIERLLTESRRSGDARALTDRQAASVAATAARIAGRIRSAEARRAAADAPPDLPASPITLGDLLAAPAVCPRPERRPRPEPVRRRTFGAGEDAARVQYVARLRDMSSAQGLPRVASGLAHLADLFEHCSTAYPEFLIPSSHVTLESTDREFPRATAGRSLYTSHAALCLAG